MPGSAFTSSKPPTFLVTGGTGFLGSHLVHRLLKEQCNVVLLKRSTSDLSRLGNLSGIRFYNIDRIALKTVFEENAIDIVVHCATNYGRSQVSPIEIVSANLTLPLELLQLSETFGIRAFINTDTMLDKGVSHYSLSKKQFLDWLMLFSKTLVCVNVSLEHFYGPFDDPSKFVTRMLQDLILETDRIALTPGEQMRDFIFIQDVVDAFMHVFQFSTNEEFGFYRFEVGSGQNISIRHFLSLAVELTGNRSTNLDFGALTYREKEVMASKVDIEKLLSLGWRPSVPLNEGLARTIAEERKRLSP